MGMGRTHTGVIALVKRIIAPAAFAACAVASLAAPSGASAATQCYFPSSFFCQKLEANAPVDSASGTMVTQLRNMAHAVDPQQTFDCTRAVSIDNLLNWTTQETQYCNKLTYLAGINYDDYAPMLYTVPADQPRIPVILDATDTALRNALWAGVPVPEEAQAAGGTD